MKKFLIDTYRIFLLQTSKVIWDIVGLSLFIYFAAFISGRMLFVEVSFIGQAAAVWIVFRLFYAKNRLRIAETESLRPIHPAIINIASLLVLVFFFLLSYGVTAYFTYNYRIARILYWLRDTGIVNIDFRAFPFSNYRNVLNYSDPSLIKEQVIRFQYAAILFWYYAIPLALIMQFRKVQSVFLFIIFFIVTGFFAKSAPDFFFALDPSSSSDNFFKYFIISYFLLIVPLLICVIIPKPVNFKR